MTIAACHFPNVAEMPLNSSRVHLDAFVRQAAASVAPGLIVLDAGAGNSPYRQHFENHLYESADFMKVDKPYATEVSYVCDLSEIPVEDDRFDLVVITQVLEHLFEPANVLREMRRVLKPGRRIWASAPLFYEEHEQPYDFFRYTQFALRRLFDNAGFSDITINWLEGYLGTFAYQLNVATATVPRPLALALKTASEGFARADVRRRLTTVGHPKNYTIIATA